MWTKINKKNPGGFGRSARVRPAVSRMRNGNAFLMLPEAYVTANRADIYQNPAYNSVGFRLHGEGEWSVTRNSPKGKTWRIAIPAQYASLIPLGTHDVDLGCEDGRLVLDLNQFTPAVRVAV